MPRNVIILTTGLAGSSVLTGLLAEAGYWTGDDTFKKSDYNTFENQELVELNRGIFKAVGYERNYTMEFSRNDVRMIAERSHDIDPAPYRDTRAEALSVPGCRPPRGRPGRWFC